MGMHDGHRQRKKDQFRLTGLDSFADHEVLELLLFYAIPRQDTNPIAHRLLERFGTLDTLFAAPISEIQKVEGVGENAATLIKMLFPVCRRVRMSARKRETIINSCESAGEFFKNFFYGEEREVFYEACLDVKGKLLMCFRLAEGAADTVAVNQRKLVENALLANASRIVLAHNHPSGVATPSRMDICSTRELRDALATVGVELLDHIIVADDDFVSLSASGMLAR